jgi:hypothetical protein
LNLFWRHDILQMYSVNSILVDMKYNGLWFVKRSCEDFQDTTGGNQMSPIELSVSDYFQWAVFHYILVARTSCILVRLWLSLQTQLRYGTELWFIFQVCCTSTWHHKSLLTSCYSVILVSSLLSFNLPLPITPTQLLVSIPCFKFVVLLLCTPIVVSMNVRIRYWLKVQTLQVVVMVILCLIR